MYAPLPGRTWRLLALVVPWPLFVALLSPADRALVATAALALGVLWVAVAAVLAARLLSDRSGDGARRVDLLTATGASVMFAGAGALLAAQLVGWASLTVVGLLGIGVVYVAVIWTGLVAAGGRPWRRASIEREIAPASAVEGDPLREIIRLGGVAIPAGMRLFVLGRPMRHGPVTRHVVEASASGAQLELVAELGPARRGEHRPPPLELWFGDVLGLTRTPVGDHSGERGETAFTVVPRVEPIDDIERLIGRGGDDAATVSAQRMPTDGVFRIREYVPGDDARRIHWIRSLQQDRLVVRLPDEIPAAVPAVRLVLDNELAGAEMLTCRAPDELLDALVRVWLSAGVAIAATGVRVVLVTAVPHDDEVARVERPMTARLSHAAQRLGARVAWQARVPLAALAAPAAPDALAALAAPTRDAAPCTTIVVSSRPRKLDVPARWLVVPESAWVAPEPPLRIDRPLFLPFPIGSAENRRGRRRREYVRVTEMWSDRAVFSQLGFWIDWSTCAGGHVARPRQDRVRLEVIP